MSAKEPSGFVIYCGRDHYGNLYPSLLQNLFYGIESCFGIKGIVDCLHKEKVCSTIYKAAHLLFVCLRHKVEGDCAVIGTIKVRRYGERFYHWPHRACHQGLVRSLAPCGEVLRYGLLRYLCSFAVKFIYFIGRVVGLLREAVAAEGVGLYNVRSGLKVGEVGLHNNIGTGYVKIVIVALSAPKVACGELVSLKQCSHCPIKDQNAIPQKVCKVFSSHNKEKAPGIKQRALFAGGRWGSNPRPLVPQTSALTN